MASRVVHCTHPLTRFLRVVGCAVLAWCLAMVALGCSKGGERALVALLAQTPFYLFAALACSWSQRYRIHLPGEVETRWSSLGVIERRRFQCFVRLRVEEGPSGSALYGEDAPGHWVYVGALSKACAVRLERALRS